MKYYQNSKRFFDKFGVYMHKIIADENIPAVREAFAHLGEVRLLPGRAIAREALADANLLLVRSVTPVNVKLLQDAAVRFVGTATIGTDHVDTAYLEQQGIAFSSAAVGEQEKRRDFAGDHPACLQRYSR
jgi:phosphoglycerate dehydrogenase-like enzyme